MDRKLIDQKSWVRRNEFEFFIKMAEPLLGITSEVETQKCLDAAKRNGESFFIYYSYAIIKAINDIAEFRTRVIKEEDGQINVYDYDVVDFVSPIKVDENGRYTEIRVPYTPDFREFYMRCKDIIVNATAVDGEIFAPAICDGTYACISAMPDIHFTSVRHAMSRIGGINQKPLISVGKMVTREGRSVMPIAITFHHGLVDGSHLSRLFCKIQQIMDSFE